MVRTGVLRDAEFAAQEGAADLGDEFFGGIGVIAEAFSEFTGKALFGAGPMDWTRTVIT